MTKQSYPRLEEDEEYKPHKQNKTTSRKKKNQLVSNESKNSSKWNLEQNKRFLNFVKLNKEMLACPVRRKEERVFLRLSQAILTRTPDQCRSHHQKMIKHHNDLDGIIEHLENKLSNMMPQVKIEEDFQIEQQNIEKKEKVEENFFFDTIIDIQMESHENVQKNIWDILNEEIWVEKSVGIFEGF